VSGPAGRPASPPRVVRMHWGAALTLLVASAVTVGAFGWPFLLEPGGEGEAASHASDAPWLFVVVLPLLVAVVLAEVNAGGLDAKAVALLGMLAAIGGALRALSPGAAGLEPSFAVILLGGRVFGRGFGFVLGCLTLLVGALITGGVGPWLPFQMVAAGWVGFAAGCLPGRPRGRTEVVLLATLGLVLGLAYGALMNLWFWPFAQYGEGLSFEATAGAAANAAAYARYYLATSLVWDLGRGVSSFVVLLLVGRPLLRALRRASRLAAFDAAPVFGRGSGQG
jgi:energy-coupling factor transport system substrate-specific component